MLRACMHGACDALVPSTKKALAGRGEGLVVQLQLWGDAELPERTPRPVFALSRRCCCSWYAPCVLCASSVCWRAVLRLCCACSGNRAKCEALWNRLQLLAGNRVKCVVLWNRLASGKHGLLLHNREGPRWCAWLSRIIAVVALVAGLPFLFRGSWLSEVRACLSFAQCICSAAATLYCLFLTLFIIHNSSSVLSVLPSGS